MARFNTHCFPLLLIAVVLIPVGTLAENESSGFFDKDYVTKGFSSSGERSSSSGVKQSTDSWSLTPSDRAKPPTPAPTTTPADKDSWSINNRQPPEEEDTATLLNQATQPLTTSSGSNWESKKPDSSRFGFKSSESNTPAATPPVNARKSAPDVQRHITSIMEQLKSTHSAANSAGDLRKKIDSISTYVTERVKQTDKPNSALPSPPPPTQAPTPPTSAVSAATQPSPAHGRDSTRAIPTATEQRELPNPRDFSYKSPSAPIATSADRFGQGAISNSSAVLSLIVSNSSQAQVLKYIDQLVKIHKQQAVPVGEVLIVGTPSLKSFFDPEIWKLFDDIEQAGIIVRPVLTPPKRLNITKSPAWVVRYNGQDYIYEAEQSPHKLFNAQGMFLGAK